MKILRTPESAFAGLPDFPYEPRYVEVDAGDGSPSVRVAHVEAGEGHPVLLMHGEPSWSFLYRHVIPGLAAEGFHALAPDLVGFGRSDKPSAVEDYSYARHVAWMRAWFEAQRLEDVLLFCQDWGGLVGLRLVAAMPERFAGVVVANTGLPTGEQKMPAAFVAWREFARATPSFSPGQVVQRGTVTELRDEVLAAYDAPYPDESFKAGARIFPSLVPSSPDDPAASDQKAAWDVLSKFDKPFITAFSDSDPITHGGQRPFEKLVAGAQGKPHRIIEGGGHFVQEDRPDAVVRAILDLTNLA